MVALPSYLLDYYTSGASLVCELGENPYLCEFWTLNELEQFNLEYEVEKYAPGFFGFATSGGGEMFAIAPSGAIVCLPFIGMSPEAMEVIADGWLSFRGLLKNAL